VLEKSILTSSSDYGKKQNFPSAKAGTGEGIESERDECG
jgi:hypothetical protein